LRDDFSKDIDLEPLAETWECSTHPDDPITIASGEHEGRLLSDILKEYPEYMGTHPRKEGELPILIKLHTCIIRVYECSPTICKFLIYLYLVYQWVISDFVFIPM